MDIVGTLPASSGRRYYLPSELPSAQYAPASYASLRERYDPAFGELQALRDKRSKIASKLTAAERDYVREAAAAKRAGERKNDPRPKLREQLEAVDAEIEVQEQIVVDLSAEIFENRHDPDAQSWWKGATDAAREDLL